MENKEFERNVFKFLKTKFDDVEWLSRTSATPIDFRCFKDDNPYLIDAKQINTRNKVRLLPTQKKVDAIVFNHKDGLKLLWKKDFKDFVIYDRMCLIKVSEEIKDLLDKSKKHPRETYNEAITRLLYLK